MMLKDKTAIVYGGGGVIGAAVAGAFAREGARVFLAGRDRAKLERAAAACGGEFEQVDVLDGDRTAAHAASVAGRTGGIDIVFNATGFDHDHGTTLGDLDVETFMQPVDRFLRSLFFIAKAVAPHMGGQRGGAILTMSVPAARLAFGGHLGHAAAAAGAEAFCRTLADEMGPRNVRVVTLRSHAIAGAAAAGSYTAGVFGEKASAMGLTVDQWLGGAAQGTMLRRLPSLEDIAQTAAFVASDRAAAMTGAVVNLTCGLIAD